MQQELLSAFGTLIFIALLLALVLFFVKRYAARKQTSSLGGPEMRVLNRVNLQPRKQIYMLQIADRVLIVGVSENTINILSEITDPAEVSRITGQTAPLVSGTETNKKIFPKDQIKVPGIFDGKSAPDNKQENIQTPGAPPRATPELLAQLRQAGIDSSSNYSRPESSSELSFADFLKSMRSKVTPPRKNS